MSSEVGTVTVEDLRAGLQVLDGANDDTRPEKAGTETFLNPGAATEKLFTGVIGKKLECLSLPVIYVLVYYSRAVRSI